MHVQVPRKTDDKTRYEKLVKGIPPGSYRVWCGPATTALMVDITTEAQTVTVHIAPR